MVSDIQAIMRQLQLEREAALIAENQDLLARLNAVLIGLGTLRGWIDPEPLDLPSVPPLRVPSSGPVS